MDDNRRVYYKTVLVNNNKELDLLDTEISNLSSRDYTTHIVRQGEENRLYMISLKYYSTTKLWWYIAKLNNIIDPFGELPVGTKIKIPNIDPLFIFHNSNSKKDEIDRVFAKKEIKILT
mgnify:CR=1 FL=1